LCYLLKIGLMRELIKYAWTEIKRRKSRNIWNILGYSLAVAFLILTLSFAGTSVRGTTKMLNYTGAQFIGFIYATSLEDSTVSFTDPEHESLLIFNNPTVLFPAQVIDLIRQSSNVKNATPLLTFRMITDEYVSRSWVIAGFDPADMEAVRMVSCSNTYIVQGHGLQSGDTGVVLLEQTFADAEQYNVDDTIYLGDNEFRVQGILSPGTRPAKADIYMPLNEAIAVLNTRIKHPVENVINVVLVDGASSLLNRSAMKDVKEILGFNSSTIGYGCFDPAGAAIGITSRGMKYLGLIIFISIILLIASSQYYSVVERSNDIGILKAIGWPEHSIISQVLIESSIQSGLGGLAGCIAAMLIFTVFPVGKWLGLDQAYFSFPDLTVLLAGFLLTVTAGALSGTFAAFMSARLKPADILRKL
jgi:putative ABC transport system permease protein